MDLGPLLEEKKKLEKSDGGEGKITREHVGVTQRRDVESCGENARVGR